MVQALPAQRERSRSGDRARMAQPPGAPAAEDGAAQDSREQGRLRCRRAARTRDAGQAACRGGGRGRPRRGQCAAGRRFRAGRGPGHGARALAVSRAGPGDRGTEPLRRTPGWQEDTPAQRGLGSSAAPGCSAGSIFAGDVAWPGADAGPAAFGPTASAGSGGKAGQIPAGGAAVTIGGASTGAAARCGAQALGRRSRTVAHWRPGAFRQGSGSRPTVADWHSRAAASCPWSPAVGGRLVAAGTGGTAKSGGTAASGARGRFRTVTGFGPGASAVQPASACHSRCLPGDYGAHLPGRARSAGDGHGDTGTSPARRAAGPHAPHTRRRGGSARRDRARRACPALLAARPYAAAGELRPFMAGPGPAGSPGAAGTPADCARLRYRASGPPR